MTEYSRFFWMDQPRWLTIGRLQGKGWSGWGWWVEQAGAKHPSLADVSDSLLQALLPRHFSIRAVVKLIDSEGCLTHRWNIPLLPGKLEQLIMSYGKSISEHLFVASSKPVGHSFKSKFVITEGHYLTWERLPTTSAWPHIKLGFSLSSVLRREMPASLSGGDS
jgi:hypothetical protein